jgi:hypothetical protein
MRGKEVTRKLLNLRNLAVRVLAIGQGPNSGDTHPSNSRHTGSWIMTSLIFSVAVVELDNLQVQ